MPLRALFFVDVPHRFTGAQRSLLAALQRLSRFDVDPVALFPSEGICAQAYRTAGIRTLIAAAPPSLLAFGKKHVNISLMAKARLLIYDALPYARLLAHIMQEEGAQVVHFNAPRGILIGGVAAKTLGLGCVLHHRGFLPFGGTYWLAAQALADVIIVVSRAIGEDVYPAARGRMRVVYNGVDVPRTADRAASRRAMAQRLGRPLRDEEIVFLSLSSPVPFKGLHHLLAAAASARAQGLCASYVLAGAGADPAYERWLVRRRHDLGLEDVVHLIGYVDDPFTLLGGADALVLPTVKQEFLYHTGRALEVTGNEGFPRSILEAMALGVPTIASRVGGVEEQVEPGATGELVPPSDPDALAAALLRVGENPQWRRVAGERARDVAGRRFSLDAAAGGLARALQDLARPRDASAAAAAA